MIDNIDSDLLCEDDDYSKVEVLWMGPPNGTVVVAKGIDIDTGETVEWSLSPTQANGLMGAFEASQDTVYAFVPYWAERGRE